MAYLEGFYFKPRIDKEILEAHKEGIICLSGCISSEINRLLLAGGEPNVKKAEEAVAWFQKTFGDKYYIELQNNGLEIQRAALEPAADLAQRMGVPTVATSDVHYVRREDAEAQDILLCVNTGKFRTDTNRMKMDTNEFYLRSPEEMYAAFAGMDDAVKRSQEIADSVNIDLEIGKRHFPVFTPPDEKKSEDYLYELVHRGPQGKLRAPARPLEGRRDRRRAFRRSDGPARTRIGRDQQARLRELLSHRLGFREFRPFGRAFRRTPVDRASARSSAYALHLSHVCPLEFDLLFERFLDENRLEAPDIDIDFCQQRRGEVIEYTKERYGYDTVAQIGTFGTLQARAAIRDVGRALGMPIPAVDNVVAKVPEELHITLADAIEKSDELKKLYNTDPDRPRTARSGQAHRRARPQRRHARGGRGHRRPPADRLRPLAAREGQRGKHHAMGSGRRRKGRPAEDGLPRPAQPDDPLEGHRADRADDAARRSIPTASRSTTRKPTPCSAAARRKACSSSKAAASATSCSG